MPSGSSSNGPFFAGSFIRILRIFLLTSSQWANMMDQKVNRFLIRNGRFFLFTTSHFTNVICMMTIMTRRTHADHFKTTVEEVLHRPSGRKGGRFTRRVVSRCETRQ